MIMQPPANQRGTHVSIEGNSLNNVDGYAPPERWVAGAQRWDMGRSGGETRSMDLMLTILTGWQVSQATTRAALMAVVKHRRH